MVEKLSELGVAELVPLLTERSVVDPGQSKLERFSRIAREAAKQCRSAAPMRIVAPTPLGEAIRMIAASGEPAAVLTTRPSGTSLMELRVLRVVVGPEGGWSARELEEMEASGLTPARLTQTILRTETAAVCAAGLLAVRGPPLG
jgi:16S rRNA (uracil1498-N3)-methyltransferase